ncbi:MAG: hypothetical protein JWO97_1115 [Acidobacteria bacterium]|nr:hypothetical protein [Acidobacteriota bacterium]
MLRSIVLALLAAYVALLLRNSCFFAAGPDSSGYLGEARMFAAGHLRVDVTPPRTLQLDRSFTGVFTPLGFDPYRNTSEMVPTYPPGLPLHFAIAGMVGGWKYAPYLVITLAAILALLLMYGIARELELPTPFAIASAALLAASPIFITFAMQPMSDLPATTWALAAIWFALRSRRVPALALAAGVAFAIGVWVRPTNILLGVALLFALPLRIRQLAFAALGALPFAIALAWLQSIQYGGWFRTPYGTVGDVVSASMPCLAFHAGGTLRMVTPLVVIGAMLVIAMRGVAWHTRAMLVSWFGVFFVFYGAYHYCEGWISSRFLLPAIPALIVGALIALERLTRSRRVLALIAFLIVVIVEARAGSKLKVFRIDDYESVYPESVRYVEQRVPKDALLITGVLSGAFYNAGRWTARWDRLDAEHFATLRAAAHAPVYAMISDVEVPAAELHRRLPGRWLRIGRIRDVTLFRVD